MGADYIKALFRAHPHDVAETAGMDPTGVSGHSLRAGLATAAASAGVQERVIAQTTGHKSMTVLRRYFREGIYFRRTLRRRWGCRPWQDVVRSLRAAPAAIARRVA